MIRTSVISVIDFFHRPFRKWIPEQTFRYAVCGGGNTFLDIFLYFIAFNYILQKQVLFTPLGAIKPHIAAFLISFMVSFPTGYLLNRFVVFPGSVLKGRIQLFRYFLLVIVCLLLNYIFIKLFVEQFHFYPTVSKIFTTVIVVSFSYLTQKNFTFKSEKESRQPGGQPAEL
jgi:putative flippase GtrA